MMELLDTSPHIQVDPAEYARLLGYPRGHLLSGRALELAQRAREWYAHHGRPWIYARECRSVDLAPGKIRIDGVPFSSARLEQTLSAAQGNRAIVVAVSAGPEAEAEAQRLWQQEKPDEYFFLEIYGSAVVEHLTTMAGARLCAWADERAMAVLPHDSPGYPEWDIAQLPALLKVIQAGAGQPLPHALEALPTGMLRPKKSLLAVFGVTAQVQRVARLTSLNPCQNCSYAPCQFRRAPYLGNQVAEVEVAAAVPLPSRPAGKAPLEPDARYAVNLRALQRWAGERLTLSRQADGTINARFRYDGTTCSNMGRPLTFHYHVALGPREEGYPLRQMQCRPAPGDEGHKFMCRYITHAEALMSAIDEEKPLLGRPLNDVLDWARPKSGAGCYCEAASRQHKWGLALETIHFALSRQDAGDEPPPLPA